jgi:hypothetical protein
MEACGAKHLAPNFVTDMHDKLLTRANLGQIAINSRPRGVCDHKLSLSELPIGSQCNGLPNDTEDEPRMSTQSLSV